MFGGLCGSGGPKKGCWGPPGPAPKIGDPPPKTMYEKSLVGPGAFLSIQGMVHVPEAAISVHIIQVSEQGTVELVFKGSEICDVEGPCNSGGPGHHSKIERPTGGPGTKY